MSDDLDLVTLATYLSLAEAQTAKMLLEEEAIVAELADAEMGQFFWVGVGYVKLQVPRHSVERATQFLEEHLGKQRERMINPAMSEAETCLECGANLPAESTVCPKCGWSFLSAVGGQPSSDDEPIES